MTAAEYLRWVVSSEDPWRHSVRDKEFQALSPRDRDHVVATFDGYGLRDAVARYKSRKVGV